MSRQGAHQRATTGRGMDHAGPAERPPAAPTRPVGRQFPAGDGRALHVISLGAGVQSTTLALMAAHGEIEPMPDAAIFADTGAEPPEVYEHLEWLRGGNVLPFPVHVCQLPGAAQERLHLLPLPPQ